MKRFLPALCLTAMLSIAQTAIAPPQLGWVRDANNGLRPVTGLAANFILGGSVAGNVISSAFSGSFGIVKTGTSLLVLDRDAQIVFQADAESGPALFAFSDDGVPAFVYLTQPQTLLKWTIDRWEPARYNLDVLGGLMKAIAAPSPDHPTAIIKREDGLWLIDLDLGTQTLLPGMEGPVLLRNNGAVLYAGPQSLVLRQADGMEQAIEGSVTAAAFELMGRDWVHVTERESSRHFALRFEPGSKSVRRDQMFQLPEAQP